MEREKQRKGATAAVGADKADLSPQQYSQFAADGETEAGAAIFTRSARIRLLERFKDKPLLLWRHADAGVGNGECNHLRRHAQHRMVGAPTLGSQPDANVHFAM